MTPIDFVGRTVIIGENQPEYNPLPAHVSEYSVITTCWEMTKEEREIFLVTGKIYLQQHTFRQPMQPIFLSIENPIPSPQNN